MIHLSTSHIAPLKISVDTSKYTEKGGGMIKPTRHAQWRTTTLAAIVLALVAPIVIGWQTRWATAPLVYSVWASTIILGIVLARVCARHVQREYRKLRKEIRKEGRKTRINDKASRLTADYKTAERRGRMRSVE